MSADDTPDARVTDVHEVALSPWVTLVSRTLRRADGSSGIYHSFKQSDYVNVVAETRAGEIILVEQFRPAVAGSTLELPGGLLEAGEDPQDCARRELAEEAGYQAPSAPILLGSFMTDPGRLENRIWGFYTGNAEPIAGWQPEPGVTRVLMTHEQLKADILSGRFQHGLHVGLLCLAVLRGEFAL